MTLPLVTRLGQSLRAAWTQAASLPLKDWSEIAKNVAQVVAVIAAGIWTYEMFIAKEAATLQRHATTGGDFYWDKPSDDGCLGNYYVTLTNDGITDFDVRRVVVSMWEFTVASLAGGATFVDVDDITRRTPMWTRTYRDPATSVGFSRYFPFLVSAAKNAVTTDPAVTPGVFVRHFPPGHGRRQRFTWFFKRVPQRNVYISVKFFTDDDVDEADWEQNYWWEVCKPPDVNQSDGK